MNAEAKAHAQARELCEAAKEFRRTGGIIERTETVKALPADVVERIKLLENTVVSLEAKHVQTMHALQSILQFLEDERAKREKLQAVVVKIAEGADDMLRKAV